jgi:thiol-disulfide isomerase/thioredoxin
MQSRYRNSRSLVCGAFSLVAAAPLFVAGCGKSDAPSGKPGEATPGGTTSAQKKEEATPVVLKSVDPAGLQQVLDEFKDQKKAVLVDFWATWCGPCKEGFPHTVELARKYGGDGLAVVTVALEEDPKETEAAAKEFLTEQNAGGLTTLISSVEGEKAFDAFEIDGGAIPHYRLYGKDGQLAHKFVHGDPEKKFTHADIERETRAALGLPEVPAK